MTDLVIPSEALEGSDVDVVGVAEPLRMLANMIELDQPLSRGNVEWLTRIAQTFAWQLGELERTSEDSDRVGLSFAQHEQRRVEWIEDADAWLEEAGRRGARRLFAPLRRWCGLPPR